MNIWLIQIGETLPIKPGKRKLRTAMLTEKLVERGHRVLWWASAFDHFEKKWVFNQDVEVEIQKGISIKALKGSGYRKNISFFRYLDHRLIARKFKKLAPSLPRPDIIVASTPSYDLAYEAVTFARKNDVPVLVDIRDQWPDIFLDQLPQILRKAIRFLLIRDFHMIRRVMSQADGLLSMMDTLLQWGLTYAKREATWKDRVFYLGYDKSPVTHEVKKEIRHLRENVNGKFVVIFIGTFAAYHNPSILVEAAAKVAHKDICFILGGAGELFLEVKRKASGLNNVILPGWLNRDDMTALLDVSHVGVCPASQRAFFFPNKSFSYFSAGLPVITAFEGDLRKIIEERDVGFYYPPNDVDALVNSIKRLHDDPVLYRKMSENAHRLFDAMFDADKIYSDYADHIEKVMKDREKPLQSVQEIR